MWIADCWSLVRGLQWMPKASVVYIRSIRGETGESDNVVRAFVFGCFNIVPWKLWQIQ
jgi:hypothetical protein